MATQFAHDWDLTPGEAVALQKRLQDSIVVEPLAGPVSLVAGCDLSFDRGSDQGYAGIVVLRLPGFEIVDRAGVVGTMRFPYIPGLLSFREIPLLLQAWDRLLTKPDVIFVDGQGLAHPRRLGIASHFGLLIDMPTIGCAKSILVGSYDALGNEPGSTSPLVHRAETIGAALRTKRATAPVIVSIGHRIDLATSIALTMACRLPARIPARERVLLFGDVPEGAEPVNARYRIPEPTRQAHLFVNAMRRGEANAARVE